MVFMIFTWTCVLIDKCQTAQSDLAVPEAEIGEGKMELPPHTQWLSYWHGELNFIW